LNELERHSNGSKGSGKGSKGSGKGSKGSGKGEKGSGKGEKGSGKGEKGSGKGSKGSEVLSEVQKAVVHNWTDTEIVQIPGVTDIVFIRDMLGDLVVPFWRPFGVHPEPNGVFSNFFEENSPFYKALGLEFFKPYPFLLDLKEIGGQTRTLDPLDPRVRIAKTSEHQLFALQALFFGDQILAEKILHQPTPAKAKSTARELGAKFKEELWTDEARYNFSIRVLLDKFKSTPWMTVYLMATSLPGCKPTELVEASPYDSKWGVGIEGCDHRIRNPRIRRQWYQDPHNRSNILGQSLMAVREMLYKEFFDQTLDLCPEYLRILRTAWDNLIPLYHEEDRPPPIPPLVRHGGAVYRD
jgi:ribA/ribD-fused uncharacterized protein